MASKNTAMAGNIDLNKVNELQKRVDTNSTLIEELVDSLVRKYCSDLDDYVKFIRSILKDDEKPPTDLELDDFIMNLPVLIYYTSNAEESLGIKDDVSKALKMELYNSAYEKAEGTISDKTATAELAVQNEYIMNVAYSRAYRKIKLRLEAANEILQSVKKVVSRRIAEYEKQSRVEFVK